MELTDKDQELIRLYGKDAANIMRIMRRTIDDQHKLIALLEERIDDKQEIIEHMQKKLNRLEGATAAKEVVVSERPVRRASKAVPRAELERQAFDPNTPEKIAKTALKQLLKLKNQNL